MLSARVDTSRLKAAVARVKGGTPQIRHDATLAAAGVFVKRVAAKAPRDTRRYVRGWILAGRAAGVTDLVAPPIQPGQYERFYRERLVKQRDDWQRMLEIARRQVAFWQGARGRGRLSPGQRAELRQAEKDLRVAERTARRAQEELAKFNAGPLSTVYGVDGVDAGDEASGALVIFGKRGKRRLTVTVRNKVYGGNGYVRFMGSKAVVVLINLEPHSKIVEKRTGIVAASLKAAKAVGLVVARRLYVRAVNRQYVAGGR